MRDFPRFIKLGDDRINVDEIVAYGIKYYEDDDDYYEYVPDENSAPVETETDEDDETYRCLYVTVKNCEDDCEFDEDELGCSLDEKLVELDALFLIAAHRPR